MRRGRARRTDLEARHRRPPRPADAFPARGPCTDIHRGGKMLGSAPLWRRRGWWRGRRAGESRRAGRWCHQHRTPRWGPRRTASPRLSDGRPASSTQPAFRSGANPPEGHLGLSGSSRPLGCRVGITQEWIPRTRASCPTLGLPEPAIEYVTAVKRVPRGQPTQRKKPSCRRKIADK